MTNNSLVSAMNAVQWTALPDGRLMFKGPVGGYPRQVVGADAGSLVAMIERMAAGKA